MKQRNHKPHSDGLSPIARALKHTANHSTKPLQRLRHALGHFRLVRLGWYKPVPVILRRRAMAASPILTLAAAVAAVSVPTGIPDQEQALLHLANYKRMIAQPA